MLRHIEKKSSRIMLWIWKGGHSVSRVLFCSESPYNLKADPEAERRVPWSKH
jgi:hypothetical protein